MHISILNGSPRTNGATASLLKKAKEILSSKSNISVDYFDLASFEMQFCKGCITCYRTGKCIIQNDGIEELSIKIRNSDGIIIGTPTNGSNVSPILKNFMDRSHYLLEQALYNKICLSIVTYEIADGNEAKKIVDKFFMISGGIRQKGLIAKVDFNENPFKYKNVESKLVKRINQLIETIEKKKSKSIFDNILVDNIIIKHIWRPVFLKNSVKYAGILAAWKEKGIGQKGKSQRA